eukprot:1691505-Prymnesium_polylepis.1
MGGKPPTKGEIKACKQLIDAMDPAWADTDDEEVDHLDVADERDEARMRLTTPPLPPPTTMMRRRTRRARRARKARRLS